MAPPGPTISLMASSTGSYSSSISSSSLPCSSVSFCPVTRLSSCTGSFLLSVTIARTQLYLGYLVKKEFDWGSISHQAPHRHQCSRTIFQNYQRSDRLNVQALRQR